MKREIVYAHQFKKDMKLAQRRGLQVAELVEVVTDLANDIPLPVKNKDHALQGDYIGYRECHIKPDWLLIYRKTDNNELQILELVRTGTHPDLFKK